MSLLNKTLAAELTTGAYMARILDYKEVDDRIHKPYIAILLDIEGNTIEDRWYESRIPYITSSLRKQFHLQYTTVTLVDLLDRCTKEDFAVIVSYDDRYGRQISYTAV